MLLNLYRMRQQCLLAAGTV